MTKAILYHNVLDDDEMKRVDPQRNTGWTTKSRFESGLLWLKAQGYKFITADDYLKDVRYEKAVMITFDDGALSIYDYAMDFMAKHGIMGTMFIHSAIIENPNGRALTNMNGAQLKEMAQAGWAIGSHSHSHANLAKVEIQRVMAEVIHSKNVIEEKTGKACLHFATPYGAHSPAVIEQIMKYYKVHYSCDKHIDIEHSPRNNVGRWNISDADINRLSEIINK